MMERRAFLAVLGLAPLMGSRDEPLIGGAGKPLGERWETAMYCRRGRLWQGPCVVVRHDTFRGRRVSVWEPCGPAVDMGPASA